MSSYPTALWLNTSQSFQPFESPLLRYLFNHVAIARWEYSQSPDEPSSLEVASTLLHDYLKQSDRTVHLLGHGTAGMLAWLYACRHPERVQSLTLLGVGAKAAIDWQAHYYALRGQLPCDRVAVLAQMVRYLFGEPNYRTTKSLIEVLDKDLLEGLSPHYFPQQEAFDPGELQTPLLVCGSEDDIIVHRNALETWRSRLKKGDELWTCPQGHHFFHYFHAPEVGRQIVRFWNSLPPTKVKPEVSLSC